MEMKLISVLSVMACFATPVLSQQRCLKTGDLYQHLEMTYQEHRKGYGITDSGALVEFWVSESGSWTSFASFPDGMLCLLASGQDWGYEPVEKEPNL